MAEHLRHNEKLRAVCTRMWSTCIDGVRELPIRQTLPVCPAIGHLLDTVTLVRILSFVVSTTTKLIECQVVQTRKAQREREAQSLHQVHGSE